MLFTLVFSPFLLRGGSRSGGGGLGRQAVRHPLLHLPPPLPSPNLLAVSLSVRLLLAGFNRLPFQAPLFSPPVDLL